MYLCLYVCSIVSFVDVCLNWQRLTQIGKERKPLRLLNTMILEIALLQVLTLNILEICYSDHLPHVPLRHLRDVK